MQNRDADFIVAALLAGELADQARPAGGVELSLPDTFSGLRGARANRRIKAGL
jgi:hypothetical protein